MGGLGESGMAEDDAGEENDDSLHRFANDPVFRARGPSTGKAELKRLAHRLTHHEFTHARHEHHRSEMTGLINRFSLSTIEAKSKKEERIAIHDVPPVHGWKDEVLNRMYSSSSPNEQGKSQLSKQYVSGSTHSWKLRGVRQPNMIVVTDTKLNSAPNRGIVREQWEAGDREGKWAMNNEYRTLKFPSTTPYTSRDVPDDVIDNLRKELQGCKFKIAGIGEDLKLLNKEEIDAICKTVQNDPILAGWGTHPDYEDELKKGRTNAMDEWAKFAKKNMVVDTWWDSLARWASPNNGLEQIFRDLSASTPFARSEPLLVFRLKQLANDTMPLVPPPKDAVALPTPPSAGGQVEVLKTTQVSNPPSGSVPAIHADDPNVWYQQEKTHLLLKLGYYVGETMSVEAYDGTNSSFRLPSGFGTAVYGYTDGQKSDGGLLGERFSAWRLANDGKSWWEPDGGPFQTEVIISSGEAALARLGLVHPGDEYTGMWKDGKKHDQQERAISTMSFVDGGTYVGMWENDQPHGNGTYYHPSGWKWQGTWKCGSRTEKMGLFYTPRSRWGRRGRKGFWSANRTRFETCEEFALRIAETKYGEDYKSELDAESGANKPETRGGALEAAKRLVVQGSEFPYFTGGAFKDKVILRASGTATIDVIKRAFEQTSPAELAKGRDTGSYVCNDATERYHELVPVAVFDIDYTYHPQVRHAYERAVFRVQENRDNFDAAEKAWYSIHKPTQFNTTTMKTERTSMFVEKPSPNTDSEKYKAWKDAPDLRKIIYPGPRAAKFPVFKPTETNPEGIGIKIEESEYDPYSMDHIAIERVAPPPDDYGGNTTVVTDYYRKPIDFEEATTSMNGKLLRQVVTRTDRLFGMEGEKLLQLATTDSQEPLLNTDVNEKLLFHGTGSKSVERVLSNGFDGYFTDKGMFGAVCYFAEDPGKADQYARLSGGEKHSSHQTQHFDERLKKKLGIDSSMYEDAVMSLRSGLARTPSKDIFYMFVCRACLGCPMLLDREAFNHGENGAGNAGSWESEFVKVGTVDNDSLKFNVKKPPIRMPCWVEARWKRRSKAPDGTITTNNVRMTSEFTDIPDLSTDIPDKYLRPNWTDASGTPLSWSDYEKARKKYKFVDGILRKQCKFNDAYDSLLGYGWGTRCGGLTNRMRFREFMLARSDPRHPSAVAARPTHLIAYKRMSSYPARYDQCDLRLASRYDDDKPGSFGAQWIRSYDKTYDKGEGGQHVDGPMTATENYPRLEKISNGIALKEPRR